MNQERNKSCATCGRLRGLSPLRDSWAFHDTVFTPRTEDPNERAWQMINDLIIGAQVYRNGGYDETTHLCDDCLRIGLHAIRSKLNEVLEIVDADHDKDAELATLNQRLGLLQARYNNLAHDHNRMQNRIGALLRHMEGKPRDDDVYEDPVEMAKWEATRPRANRQQF